MWEQKQKEKYCVSHVTRHTSHVTRHLFSPCSFCSHRATSRVPSGLWQVMIVVVVVVMMIMMMMIVMLMVVEAMKI